VTVREREQKTHLEVSVPALDVSLPDAPDTTLIALDDDPSVVVLEEARAALPKARREPSAGTLVLTLKLGKKVQVTQGELKVPVSGALTLAPDGRLSGTIRFPAGGVVPAFGQTFRISEGFVRFQDQDVSDGVIAVKAATRVADSTSVELNVSGTVGAPVILLQSDPPRSEDEIVALLVGLRPEDSTGDQGQQLGGVAWALAMNRLVKGSALGRLQFGAGQTSEGSEVKTVSMRVGSKVWLEGRSVRASDTSLNQSDQASGVVDWRFAPSFSLRTQLGTVSGVELRWSHGY
jgi:autotransporter translocation and assembly factor TamB